MRISDWSSDVCSSDLTFTASARISTPRRMRSRASRENFTSFAAMVPYLYFLIGNCVIGWNQPLLPSPRASADDAEDVALFHDEQVLAIDLRSEERRVGQEVVSTSISRW